MENIPWDPSMPTPCTYYFAPIAHAQFCPIRINGGRSVTGGMRGLISPAVSKVGGVTLLTTDPVTVIKSGSFECSSASGSCSEMLFKCVGSFSRALSNVTVTSLEFNAFKWESSPVSCNSSGIVLQTPAGGSWSVDGSKYTAVDAMGKTVLSFDARVKASCAKCTTSIRVH